MATHYDLIVIGAGPAGFPAAVTAAQFGVKTLLIDKRDAPGGECLFEGCIPSKVLENAANRFAEVKESELFHVNLQGTEQIHWDAVLKDKDAVVQQLAQGAKQQIQMLSALDFKQGEAKFVDTHTLSVGEELFSFDKALIATGGKTAFPPIKGNALDKVWTNRDVFFEEKLPKELLFIGAGAISCELAQMFNKLGVKCHILERSERILKHVHEDGALLIQQKMRTNGVTIDLNVNMQSVDFENGIFTVKYTQNNETKELHYENVLMATGRAANVDGLALEKATVEYDKKGVVVNDELQSSQSHIYACGDCINGPKFAHTASYEAGIAVHNMYGPSPHHVNFDINSWVLFSDPQIGVVGMDEQTAASKGMDVSIETYSYEQDMRSLIDKKAEGFLKFVIDNKTKVIVGVEIANEDAATLLGEASLIVSNKMTHMDILNAIHPHPTLTESFGRLAQQIFLKSMMKRG